MFYSASTRGWYEKPIIDDAVHVPDEEYWALLAGEKYKQIVPNQDGFPILVDPPAPSIGDLKYTAFTAIDSAAGTARTRYITTSPGQEATYLLKSAQASSFKAGGYVGPVPGLVQAEIDATGATARQATDAILAQQAAWEAIAATIESARRRGKVAVGNAVDAAGVEAASAAAIAELKAI